MTYQELCNQWNSKDKILNRLLKRFGRKMPWTLDDLFELSEDIKDNPSKYSNIKL